MKPGIARTEKTKKKKREEKVGKGYEGVVE